MSTTCRGCVLNKRLQESSASGAGGEGRTQLRLSEPERKAPGMLQERSWKVRFTAGWPPPQCERREEPVRRHAKREGPAEHHLFTPAAVNRSKLHTRPAVAKRWFVAASKRSSGCATAPTPATGGAGIALPPPPPPPSPSALSLAAAAATLSALRRPPGSTDATRTCSQVGENEETLP